MGLKDFAVKIVGNMIGRSLGLKGGNMEEGKKWWQSKTIRLALVIALINIYETVSALGPSFGFALPAIPGIVITILNAILGGGIVYTRSTATQKIV